jgi:hypothetical protein
VPTVRIRLRPSFLSLAAALGCVLLGAPLRAAPASDRVVYLASGLTPEQQITVPVAFVGQLGVLLFNSPRCREPIRNFLRAYQPAKVVHVGPSAEKGAAFEPAWEKTLFPQARRIIVAPATPRRLLLQAAWLAGVLRVPLIVSRGPADDAGLRRALANWGSKEIMAVGTTYRLCRNLDDLHVTRLLDEEAVTAFGLARLQRRGSIKTLVVTNPTDDRAGLGGMSSLAPWIAARKHAVLLLTNDHGNDVEAIVKTALRHEALVRAESVILVGSPKAIPPERRPNPVPGKDQFIEMEPLTPTGSEPFSFAVGRLFHPDPAVVLLLLAREELIKGRSGGKALVVSNPGDSLPLLETVSRSTALELKNSGYQTTALFGEAAIASKVRKLLPEQDLFLWEGHYSTLVRTWGLYRWSEPLRPSLFFLQSCLALNETEALPFLERGAVGVIGSSTRTYSATGSAVALAYFDALLYDRQTMGGSLRQAKNFLLAYSLLKRQRLGKPALAGASLRSAWAFTLWGDPTLKLPAPPLPDGALAHVRHRLRGKTLLVWLPAEKQNQVGSAGYQAHTAANIRLAGLCRRNEDDDHCLIPLVFVEARLPDVPAGVTPQLHSRLPRSAWVFLWDGRRRCGYLLLRPRTGEQGEIRFHVSW